MSGWLRRLTGRLGRAIASVVLLSLLVSCGTSRRIGRDTVTAHETVANTNYTNLKNERDSVVVEVHDTVMETKTINITKNEAGNTTFMSVVTERDVMRSRDNIAAYRTRTVVKTDTVYVERRDSVSVECLELTSLTFGATGCAEPAHARQSSSKLYFVLAHSQPSAKQASLVAFAASKV